MSVRIQMKNPPGNDAPPPSRLYWICQAAGWGSLVLYTLILYFFVFEVDRWEVVASIVVIDGGVCPWLTHALRGWMHRRGWLRRSLRSRLPRAAGAAVLFAAAVTLLVLVVARLIPGNTQIDARGAFWMFITFLWAFSGWLLIYFAVHARRQRDARELELTLDARNAQLDLLRAQVNPHFLFNCLNSLRALISEDPERASSMLTSLSDLLRYSLQAERTHTVSLAEELAIVDDYVSLERVRFEDRLRFERVLDPGALETRVPPMLVQTLVENAVKHGIADLPNGGLVRMRAHMTGRRMTIAVSNTGTLRVPHNADGHGLRNTMDRLRLLYGDQASLTLTDVSGETVATVTLPLEPTHERATG
jgi:two-component system, LytTR family, sensor kinase